MMASIRGLSARIFTIFATLIGRGSAAKSMGFFGGGACGNRYFSSNPTVARSSSGTSRPNPQQASVVTTQWPPPAETMATRFPFGRGCFASASARSKACITSYTLMIPVCRHTASKTSSAPDREAVWLKVALDPPSVPACLVNDDGFFSDDLSRLSEKTRPVPKPFNI